MIYKSILVKEVTIRSYSTVNGFIRVEKIVIFFRPKNVCIHILYFYSMDSPPINDTDCINWNQYYTECTPGEYNPFSGAISFDNIGLAWVAIFLVSNISGKLVIAKRSG